jgi:hypothetical protein
MTGRIRRPAVAEPPTRPAFVSRADPVPADSTRCPPIPGPDRGGSRPPLAEPAPVAGPPPTIRPDSRHATAIAADRPRNRPDSRPGRTWPAVRRAGPRNRHHVSPKRLATGGAERVPSAVTHEVVAAFRSLMAELSAGDELAGFRAACHPPPGQASDRPSVPAVARAGQRSPEAASGRPESPAASCGRGFSRGGSSGSSPSSRPGDPCAA